MNTFEMRMTVLALAAGLAAATAFADGDAAAPAKEGEVFARAGAQVITVQDYERALAGEMRRKFYHARPPAEELERFGREVGETLVANALLLAEAERRGIAPDAAAIEREVAGYERRYEGNAQWQRSRAAILPRLEAELSRRSRLERLEAEVRAVPPPDEGEARAFYDARPELFTEPEQLRLSLILLKVDPGAPAAARAAAMQEAATLHARLDAGADFAEAARLRSADPSAARGGDLGYVHRGMLPAEIEKQFADGLAPGEISRPAQVLEGVAIVRLEARKAPRLRAFAEVAATARALLQRERADAAWAKLKAQLRAASTVWLDESRFTRVGPR